MAIKKLFNPNKKWGASSGIPIYSDEFDRRIAQTQRLVEKSVDIVHQFARELRPAVLDDLGLIPALPTFMKNLAAAKGSFSANALATGSAEQWLSASNSAGFAECARWPSRAHSLALTHREVNSPTLAAAMAVRARRLFRIWARSASDSHK